ncbi:hypothetical protein AGOR_G00112840 [Albula goreensis]|uniref:Inversin n=1 Tax=Albula goreensis TaxID=1534307 RepID=A0A8T3D9B5_9TELE|nr:hypothetical protein AGOR_G00112840 [Albula goreensis]
MLSLHAAALSGHVSTVRLLLERGAMVDALDVMKHTPLFRACEMGHRDVILTLIKGEARVDLVDMDGHTALHWAALGGNAEVCQILMENGINPNVQDLAGRTPLQCAAYGGYINCMAILMENQADPNFQDKEGRTALHWSCNNGYLDAVKLLLGYNAFPNQMEHSEERYTPLDYALLGEHQEVTQFMLEHGALSIAAIQDIAASSIQAVYKGYKVRKAFRERKNLLMRHEQLRKDAAKKREEEHRRREAEQQVSLVEVEQSLRAMSVAEMEGGRGGSESTPLRGHSVRKSSKSERGQTHSAKSRTEDQRRHRERRSRSARSERQGKEAEVVAPAARTAVAVTPEKAETPPERTHGCQERAETSHEKAREVPVKAEILPEKARGGQTPPQARLSPKSPQTPKVSAKERGMAPKGGRHSPAGSSRPGSAKPGTAQGQALQAPRPTRASTSAQVSQRALHSPPARTGSLHHPTPTSKALLGPCQGSMDPSMGPLELRLKVVERERSRKELIHRKNLAATTIQRAWRRFHVRGRLKEALCGSDDGAESAKTTSLLIQLLWDRQSDPGHAPLKATPEYRAPTKAKGNKTTVLQSIYGGSQARRGRPTRSTTLNSRSHSQILLDLSLSTNTHLSSIECVHLLETVGQARQFSYHMRPHSATQGPKGRGKP